MIFFRTPENVWIKFDDDTTKLVAFHRYLGSSIRKGRQKHGRELNKLRFHLTIKDHQLNLQTKAVVTFKKIGRGKDG